MACVASVSVWFRSKEIPRNGISVLAEREMKREPKTESGGRGRGRKEKLADKPLDFETCVRQRTQRLIGSAIRTALHVSIKGLFHTERTVLVRDTYINFQWLLFILVGKICPPMQEHFL